MSKHLFYDDVPRLRVRDPLADLLGCSPGGVIEYSFCDAVRLTGHACPTVAAAYWLTWLSIERLYPDANELPERGGIRVEYRENARDGSTGIVATVVQMLTGAAGSSGFKGLGGRFSRAGLARCRPELPCRLRYTRLDTGAAVDADADVSLVPADPALHSLMELTLAGQATDAERHAAGTLWQDRVRRVLIDHARSPEVFTVRAAERRMWKTPVPRMDVV